MKEKTEYATEIVFCGVHFWVHFAHSDVQMKIDHIIEVVNLNNADTVNPMDWMDNEPQIRRMIWANFNAWEYLEHVPDLKAEFDFENINWN